MTKRKKAYHSPEKVPFWGRKRSLELPIFRKVMNPAGTNPGFWAVSIHRGATVLLAAVPDGRLPPHETHTSPGTRTDLGSRSR